jgi:aminoglycoside phosphotransferase (APT) family kinase protein
MVFAHESTRIIAGEARCRNGARALPWAHPAIRPVASARTDNALYRVGDDMVVRRPCIRGAVASLDNEHQWLPRLASHLPVAIPVPLAKGVPVR